MSGLYNQRKVKEQHYVSDEVLVNLEIDVLDGEWLDTRVTMDDVEFWVGGSQREKFCKELGALIDKYRI